VGDVDTSALAKWYLNERGSDAFATFEEDVANGHLFVHPVDDEALRAALALISRLDDLPLRTLDAIHLALARQLAASRLATADAQMADAASALGLEVVRFGG
jgi:hypothetical protein